MNGPYLVLNIPRESAADLQSQINYQNSVGYDLVSLSPLSWREGDCVEPAYLLVFKLR